MAKPTPPALYAKLFAQFVCQMVPVFGLVNNLSSRSAPSESRVSNPLVRLNKVSPQSKPSPMPSSPWHKLPGIAFPPLNRGTRCHQVSSWWCLQPYRHLPHWNILDPQKTEESSPAETPTPHLNHPECCREVERWNRSCCRGALRFEPLLGPRFTRA